MSYSPDSQEQPPVSPDSQQNAMRITWRLPADRPYVTYILIASCVLAFLGQMIGEMAMGVDLLAVFGAKINDLIIAGQVWRLITPMWLHGSFLHITFNMYALYVIGSGIERYYGHGRFLVLYLLSGYAGNVVSFLMSPEPSYGASTAVFGLVAAQAVFIYQNRYLFRNAKALLVNTLMIVAINLFLGLSPGIDNWGHLGGMLGGLAYAWSAGPLWKVQEQATGYVLVNQRNNRIATWVAAGVSLAFTIVVILKMIWA